MGKCLHFPMALLLLFYVAKATTEMERSGIEVRVAPCGRSRCMYMWRKPRPSGWSEAESRYALRHAAGAGTCMWRKPRYIIID